MAKYVLKIVDDKNKLSDRADEILKEDNVAYVTKIINDLKDTLRDNIDLCALAAPQIGVNKRIFCIKFANGDIRAFLNPIILTHSEEIHLSRETCASIKNTEYIIPRYNDITVGYQTPMGVPESNIFKGAPAEIFQQMCQLLDGILLDDYGLIILDGFDDMSERDKQYVIDMYLKSLETKQTELKKEINDNPDLKEIDKAIDFMTDVALGKVKIEKLNDKEQEQLKNKIKEEIKTKQK